MHIPNRNALVIPPNSCPIAKINDEISIAGIIPVLIFNLLNITPLNANSSTIGARITLPIALSIIMSELRFTVSMSLIVIQLGSKMPLRTSIAEIANRKRYANRMLITNTYIISFCMFFSDRFSMFLPIPFVPFNAQTNNNSAIKKNRIRNNSSSSKIGNSSVIMEPNTILIISPITKSLILIVLNRTLKSVTLLSI